MRVIGRFGVLNVPLFFTNRPMNPLTCRFRSLALLCRALTLIIFPGLSATIGSAASIDYGDFGPVPPGVRFNGVTESSGSDAVPLYGAPTAFSVGLDFDPTSFSAFGNGGSNDITDGQLNLSMQGDTMGQLVAIESITVVEAGSFTLSGIGTVATRATAGAILRVTVTQIDGVDVAPISLAPVNASVGFNLVANQGVNQPWSLGVTANIEGQLTSMGTLFTAGATRVDVVISNELLADSETNSIAGMEKQEFMVKATTNVVAGTPTPPPSPTPTPSSTPTPSPTPTASPTRAVNLSTRMRVQTGDNIGIGGFILTGSAPKHVLIRAIGPSLTSYGVSDPLADPVLELHGPGAFVTITNDNWRDTQEDAIQATGIPPVNDSESAIDATLAPGAYTAVMTGKGNTSGAALIEVYDLDQAGLSQLANLSTRAFVGTGQNIVIAGVLLSQGNGDDRLIVRGIGPSLSGSGLSSVLADPALELRDTNGTLLFSNNDWQDNAAQAAEITAAGLAPGNPRESGIAATLPPGLYTALLTGLNNGTGIGLVEVYDRGP